MQLRSFKVINIKPAMRRRLKFSTLIMINQMLLIALAIAWIVHMAIIAANGSVFFEERNPFILWGEISTMVIITVFAIWVLAIQVQRLGERRRDSDKRLEDRD
jgi:membrane protein YdbS with pleckstrin-like domain